eukprot:m.14555 g.14555  ORF g.14555 m.14555 type:complete len:145 (-) comp6342_c0_seq1:131-565(-)
MSRIVLIVLAASLSCCAATQYTCTTKAIVNGEEVDYDLSPLQRTNGTNWQAEEKPTADDRDDYLYEMNICHDLLPSPDLMEVPPGWGMVQHIKTPNHTGDSVFPNGNAKLASWKSLQGMFELNSVAVNLTMNEPNCTEMVCTLN